MHAVSRKHNHTYYCIQKQVMLLFTKKHSVFILILNYEFWNFWKLRINRFSHIIKWWSSQNNSTRPHNACQCKQPQEQAIQDHGNIFPIFYYLLFIDVERCPKWVIPNWLFVHNICPSIFVEDRIMMCVIM